MKNATQKLRKQGCKFKIRKYLIVGFNGREAKKPKGYFNPNLIDEPDIEKCITEHDYWGHSEAAATYSKDGTLKYFWSSEIERSDEENISRLYDLSRFKMLLSMFPTRLRGGIS